MVKSRIQLLIENGSLHSRLEEMQEALDAMRNGEVDAIMVSGSKGDQVYAISSADTPYRTFIEEMSEGAVTLARDGTVLYCNHRFALLVQTPYDKVIGSSITRFLTATDAEKLRSLLVQLKHKENDHIIVTLTNTFILRLSIRHLPSYLQGDYFILIATDISDIKKKERELVDVIEKLENHVEAMRVLRIESISENLDSTGMQNKLKATNAKLVKEMIKLNRLLEQLKKKKPEN